MVLRVCLSCTALFPSGLERCPQCGDVNHEEQSEEAMAKISAAGGPTIEGVPGLDNQSDREEDQLEQPEGGQLSIADRIEQASQPGTEEGAHDDQAKPEPTEDYASYSYTELQRLCKERGLGATGSHSELVNRLETFDQREGSGG